MIRLEIYTDGQTSPLVPNLSSDVSFEMIRENPLFTQRGDYTYDIDISLKDPHNRRIYDHLDRFTSVRNQGKRTAKLICGGETVCEGKEVFLKKDGDILKIQILAGNSELNFLTADDTLKIRDMDFGWFPWPNNTVAKNCALKIFPEVNYVFPMCIEGEWGNGDATYVNECYFGRNGATYEEGTTLRAMPFVLYLIEKFVEALGYRMNNNALRNEPKWCKLILIHGYNTNVISHMLPDWTAAEFIQYVETFFNCVFLLDPIKREVNIVNYSSLHDNPTIVEIGRDSIVDSFVRDYDVEDVHFLHDYEGVEYDLPGSDYWKRANLSKTVENLCGKIEASYSEADARNINSCQWIIFHYDRDNIDFVRVNEVIPYYQDYGTTVYRRYAVNQFKPYGNGNNPTTLKIVPVEIVVYERTARLCPKSELRTLIENVSFSDAVKSGISESLDDCMQVCFYSFDGSGLNIDFNESQAALVFKVAQCITARNYFHQTFGTSIFIPRYTGIDDMTLELNGEHGLVKTTYGTQKSIDVTQKHTIYFISTGFLNPSNLYNIAGRLFACQQIKYTFAKGKRHPVAEGVFYPYYL